MATLKINAKYFDEAFSKIEQVEVPKRPKNMKVVFHLYIIFAKKRNLLYKYCLKNGIEVTPIPGVSSPRSAPAV